VTAATETSIEGDGDASGFTDMGIWQPPQGGMAAAEDVAAVTE
jgi:hypothetical protein